MAETPETPDIRLLAISLMIEVCPGFSASGKPGCPGFSPSTRAWISRRRAFGAASALTNRSGHPSAMSHYESGTAPAAHMTSMALVCISFHVSKHGRPRFPVGRYCQQIDLQHVVGCAADAAPSADGLQQLAFADLLSDFLGARVGMFGTADHLAATAPYPDRAVDPRILDEAIFTGLALGSFLLEHNARSARHLAAAAAFGR
jgi:hypothetical protein